jgi:hypothetical protein
MFGDLESKLAAIVADRVAARTHLTVGVTPVDPPATGRGTVSVGLSDVTSDQGFAPKIKALSGPTATPQSRRVLPVRFRAAIAFTSRPATDTAADRATARALLLEDMSAVAHALADPGLTDGSGFVTAAPDPGFQVKEFLLANGTIKPVLDAGTFTGELICAGIADVWPVGTLAAEAVIDAVDPAIVPLPLALRVADAGVAPGGATTVTIATAFPRRLTDPVTGARGAARVAVAVLADVPPAQRGTITAGVAGNETGLRVLDAAGPRLVIPYRAPVANPGAAGRTEYVAVHLATADNGKGVFLGSAAIRLVGSG